MATNAELEPFATLTISRPDKDGRQTQCSFSGYGIIGGAIAKSNYDECVAQAKGAKETK